MLSQLGPRHDMRHSWLRMGQPLALAENHSDKTTKTNRYHGRRTSRARGQRRKFRRWHRSGDQCRTGGQSRRAVRRLFFRLVEEPEHKLEGQERTLRRLELRSRPLWKSPPQKTAVSSGMTYGLYNCRRGTRSDLSGSFYPANWLTQVCERSPVVDHIERSGHPAAFRLRYCLKRGQNVTQGTPIYMQ